MCREVGHSDARMRAGRLRKRQTELAAVRRPGDVRWAGQRRNTLFPTFVDVCRPEALRSARAGHEGKATSVRGERNVSTRLWAQRLRLPPLAFTLSSESLGPVRMTHLPSPDHASNAKPLPDTPVILFAPLRSGDTMYRNSPLWRIATPLLIVAWTAIWRPVGDQDAESIHDVAFPCPLSVGGAQSLRAPCPAAAATSSAAPQQRDARAASNKNRLLSGAQSNGVPPARLTRLALLQFDGPTNSPFALEYATLAPLGDQSAEPTSRGAPPPAGTMSVKKSAGSSEAIHFPSGDQVRSWRSSPFNELPQHSLRCVERV